MPLVRRDLRAGAAARLCARGLCAAASRVPRACRSHAVNSHPLAEMLAEAHAAGLEFTPSWCLGAILDIAYAAVGQGHQALNCTVHAPRRPARADNAPRVPACPMARNTSSGGYRFGVGLLADFGHPAAASYTVNVLLDLVLSYPIDGLHLDRLQYPEIGGGPSEGGASVGYTTSACSGSARNTTGRWTAIRHLTIRNGASGGATRLPRCCGGSIST